MNQNNFNERLEAEIAAISIDAKARGFAESNQILYRTDYTIIIVYAFHIPRKDGRIHHFDLTINKYQRKKKSEPWVSSIEYTENSDQFDIQSLKIDSGNGSAVKKLAEFINAQYEAIGQKIESNKVIIDNPEDMDLMFVKRLSLKNLENINSLVSITRLEEILKIWNSNKENNKEEWWQNIFQENTWILSQVFACPFVQIGKKFYCGGKEDDDKGGVKGDFLYKNELTGNLSFVEIKTPETTIVGNQYRGAEEGKENVIYSMSNDLTGGVNQVLNQRKIYLNTHGDNNGKFLHNAKCVLVVGQISKLQSDDEKKSFELYRSSAKDVEVITFDELFGRVQTLLDLLKE